MFDDPRVLLVGTACLIVILAAALGRRLAGRWPRTRFPFPETAAGRGGIPPAELLARLYQQVETAILVTDCDGIIRYANPQQCQASGYTLEELQGRNVRMLRSGFTPAEVYLDLWETLRGGRTWRGEFYNRRRNGELYWERTCIHPLRDRKGTITQFVAFREEVTRQKTEEIDLFRRKERAESANLRKSQLLTRLSGELRTPLNSILGFSELIKAEAFGPLEHPRYPAYVGHIAESAQGLLLLIDQVLDLARIEAGEFQVRNEVIDVESTVKAATRSMRTRAEAGGIHLSQEPAPRLPHLLADGRAVRQCLTQLLDNALRFTRGDGRVTVRAWLGPDGGIEIAVIDTGVGMEQADIADVLDAAEAAAGKVGQTARSRAVGLGLPLTRSLVALHGGSITINSSLGVGTTVAIHFPRARTLSADPSAEALPP